MGGRLLKDAKPSAGNLPAAKLSRVTEKFSSLYSELEQERQVKARLMSPSAQIASVLADVQHRQSSHQHSV